MHERNLSREVQFVRSLDGEFYLLDEVATLLNVSPRRLRRLMESDPHLAPSARAYQGLREMFLYTPADVDALVDYLANYQPVPGHVGRQPMWTVAQYQDRQRRDRSARVQRRRADELERRGDHAGAQAARHRARQLADQLRAEYDQRLGEMRASAAARRRRSAAAAAAR